MPRGPVARKAQRAAKWSENDNENNMPRIKDHLVKTTVAEWKTTPDGLKDTQICRNQCFFDEKIHKNINSEEMKPGDRNVLFCKFDKWNWLAQKQLPLGEHPIHVYCRVQNISTIKCTWFWRGVLKNDK